jgi:hypothetical protein
VRLLGSGQGIAPAAEVKGNTTMRFILLWLLGVPVSVLFILWLLHII